MYDLNQRVSHEAAAYGKAAWEIYDSFSLAEPEPADTVAVLKALAAGGPVLELGIGTGRVALPLARQGIAVHGIDASAEMIAKLREKLGGAAIPVTQGDFAELALTGRYSLIFVLFNTFFQLLTREAQLRCLAGVATRLKGGGKFLLEAFVPNPALYVKSPFAQLVPSAAGQSFFVVSAHDPLTQRLSLRHVIVYPDRPDMPDRLKRYPIELRYAAPEELDELAEQAGLRLCERWSNWQRQPYTPASANQISVYERE